MGHSGHSHGSPGPVDDMDAATWNAVYDERPAIWSGEPNAQLVAEVSSLPPGTALDVGCGEGADAVWLAARGWVVTATDISSVALSRARAHAEAAGVRATFVETDLLSTPPPPRSFDLVSAQFFQLPDPPRTRAMRQLANAVSAGGHFLVVGHHPEGHTESAHAERLYTPDEITALFSDHEWQTVVSETRERTAMHHGEMTDLVDGVVLVRRLDTLDYTT
jgi:SAM-dependent methyltransferase